MSPLSVCARVRLRVRASARACVRACVRVRSGDFAARFPDAATVSASLDLVAMLFAGGTLSIVIEPIANSASGWNGFWAVIALLCAAATYANFHFVSLLAKDAAMGPDRMHRPDPGPLS